MWYKVPPRFVEDCHECDCDVGEWSPSRKFLNSNEAQMTELLSRARFYASEAGPDCGPVGLKGAAKALLKALARAGVE